MFTLLHLESSQLLERAQFSDGKRASRAARLLSIKTGQKWQPRKINQSDDSSWHNREQARFDSGEYTPLHYVIARVVKEYEEKTNQKLFAHLSKKNPLLIAYTKDAIKGAQDKQSLLSIRAFIELIAGDMDKIGKDFLINVSQSYSAQFTQAEFLIAETESDIESVYTNHAKSGNIGVSCMRYSAISFPSVKDRPYHPTRVYAAGDLAIAYKKDDDGLTTARALIWPSKKLYSRVYSASEDGDSSFHAALRRAGYNKSRYYGHEYESMSGARLLRVENDKGNLVIPYLDEVGCVSDNGENLIIERGGEHGAMETSGEIRLNSAVCECCGSECDEDDLSTVYTDSRMHDGESWCEHCRDNHSFYCHGYEENFSDSVDRSIVDGDVYCDRYIQNSSDINFCDRSEEYTFGDVNEVIINDRGHTENWSQYYCDSDAIYYEGQYYSDDLDFVEVVTERYVLRYSSRFQYNHANQIMRINAYYVDVIRGIPQVAIDDGDVEVVEAADGRLYLVGYVDHYPVTRERLDVSQDEESESIAA